MSSNHSILLCAEDTEVYLKLNRILAAEGIGTFLTSDPNEVHKLARTGMPDLILVDCRRRSFPASKVCGDLRQDPCTREVPVIALIDPAAEGNGAGPAEVDLDEAVSERVSLENLVECLRARLRNAPRLRKFADVEMDLDMYQVRRNGRNVRLGPIEYRLLRHFLEKPRQVLSRAELIDAAWTKKVYVGPRTVDVHMGRLRKALNSESERDLIRTVRSVGYALSDQSDKATASGD